VPPWEEGAWGWSGYFELGAVGDTAMIMRNVHTQQSFIARAHVVVRSRQARVHTFAVVRVCMHSSSTEAFLRPVELSLCWPAYLLSKRSVYVFCFCYARSSRDP
jgi:hypothetical protein